MTDWHLMSIPLCGVVKAGVPVCDILCVYCTVIHSILEYARPVWHPGLTKKLSKDIERVRKRCLKLLYPYVSYSEALNKSGLNRLDYRRDLITKNLFREINNPKHPLHYLLSLLKCLIVKWFCGRHTHVSFHLAELLAVNMILYHTAFLRSFRDLSL